MGRAGVLLMAHGTPGSPAEIAPFYTRIRRGRPPEPEQLVDLERRYAAIGGLSPLAERTRSQVDGVRVALESRRPGRYVVAFGAKHTDPLIEYAAGSLARAGVDRVVGLVLTPHGSSMGSEEYLARAAAALEHGPRFIAVPPWFAHPVFVSLQAARVKATLAAASAGDLDRYPVLFCAHSVPERVREAGDTYPEQLAESARLVAEAAGVPRPVVAWQSAGRSPGPWLGPDVRDVVRQLSAAGGTDGVVVCPIGFVADHLEVLYDLDVELAAVAAACGLSYARTASLNDDPQFLGALADVVAAADARAA
ncbi:MAG TPA: ferrochelatase [Acidimicrobiales bacterium]|nr:ferrochelatase [Acidimicrobiales bacterium]